MLDDTRGDRNQGETGQDATERLMTVAENYQDGGKKKDSTVDMSWREGTVEERIAYALVKGVTTFIEEDTKEAWEKYPKPLEDIEGPLMDDIIAVTAKYHADDVFADIMHIAFDGCHQDFTFDFAFDFFRFDVRV